MNLVAERTLLDELLDEQQNLSAAADHFSRWHESHTTSNDPALARYYRDLIPLSKPGPGEQYAFQVDLDVCSGCKACVVACHSLNGLEEGETWRDVGLLYGNELETPTLQTVTTACHHCEDPACANGCPVLAYEKDPETGIVRHLDDQCIGCQYCVLKCPYEVPKYSAKKGIVRKCDMCHSRLAVGEAPACVQSCPNEAIRIIKVDKTAIALNAALPIVPGAIGSDYTRPTTQYRGRRADLQPADTHKLRVEHTHWPLVLMLVLTQFSVGLVGGDLFLRWTGQIQPWLLPAAIFIFHIGLLSSITHLGQPLKAWRAFLGLRRSWLSREIIGFGMVPPLLLATASLDWLPTILSHFPLLGLHYQGTHLVIGYWSFIPANFSFFILHFAFLTGLLCVFCSVMVYADTRRPFWSLPRTSGRFFGTVLVAAMAGAGWLVPLALVLTVKITMKMSFLRHAQSPVWTPDKKSALTILRHLRPALIARLACAVFGLIIFAFQPIAGILLIVLGEVAERYLFFRAVTAPKMPGGI